MTVVLKARSMTKSFSSPEGPLTVLKGIDIEIFSGECVALLGASGSGKSTLLHCLGLLDVWDSGELEILGKKWDRKSTENQRAQMRLDHLGFVFQFHHLIPELNALENVVLPLTLRSGDEAESFLLERGVESLKMLGLAGKERRFPWQLSGGEQARVALARALVGRPKILFTDEVTGNLDRSRARDIVQLLLEINRNIGMTLVSVTHDQELASLYRKRLNLFEGRLEASSQPGL